MTDEELIAWVCARIGERTPESDMLDYKTTMDLGTKPQKLELAKDVSSFANERGGVLLYGVPETREDDVPVPKPISECGFTPTPGLREQAESILLDVIEPPLPELHLRVLSLDAEGRWVFFVYHPQSWARPHMVAGYDHARYYRRGNFRAARMKEREVDAAYASRRAVSLGAESFLRSRDLGSLPSPASLRLVLVPHLGTPRRAVTRAPVFRDWLLPQDVAQRRGFWLPFREGWRFHAHAGGNVDGRQYDVRLFDSGAVSFTTDPSAALHETESRAVLRLPRLAKMIRLYAIDVATRIWEKLRLAGPVTIRFELRASPIKPYSVMAEELWQSSPHSTEPTYLPTEFLMDEDSSVSELALAPEAVCVRLLDRVAAAGGLWMRGD